MEVTEIERRKELENWVEVLRKVSFGKSCTRIWSDLPTAYGEVCRYYLVQAIIWRFG